MALNLINGQKWNGGLFYRLTEMNSQQYLEGHAIAVVQRYT
jgi:hypothetical protein